jgi:hypothetical protein
MEIIHQAESRAISNTLLIRQELVAFRTNSVPLGYEPRAYFVEVRTPGQAQTSWSTTGRLSAQESGDSQDPTGKEEAPPPTKKKGKARRRPKVLCNKGKVMTSSHPRTTMSYFLGEDVKHYIAALQLMFNK